MINIYINICIYIEYIVMALVLLETPSSKLVKYSAKKYEELLDKCVDEIKDLLHIMGKKCNQKRNVGFFQMCLEDIDIRDRYQNQFQSH